MFFYIFFFFFSSRRRHTRYIGDWSSDVCSSDLSADEGFVFRLADAGKTLDRGTLYAEGRIVLFAPKGSPLKPDGNFADLRAALQDGRIQRFAIANPEHAPYGRAAEQALKGQGLWEAVLPKLVLGENVSQAAQFATSGSAQG